MKTIEEIMYKVWKEQLSVTNGSSEIVAMLESERARNAALVEALDELTNGIGNVQFMYNSYLQYKDSANAFNLSRSIGELGRAKAKFKNEFLSLAANTEKGGVQG